MCRPVLFLWEREDRERDAREACAACRRGFVGGWLLGCRNSAKTVFQKSELASCSRSDSGLLKNNADFRQPRISSPPAESGDRQHTPHGLVFQGGKGGWLLHRQISVFYAGGKYDLCFGAAELLEFVDEVVQFHGGAEGYFDEHGVIAGDAVAFDDVGDGLDEGVEVFFLVGFYFQVDECFYMITEKYRVDLGVVACDQPVFFEVFDPGGNSGG